MRNIRLLMLLLAAILISASNGFGQTKKQIEKDAIAPSKVSTGTYWGLSAPLRDIPALSEAKLMELSKLEEKKERNEGLRERHFPFASSALPKGVDNVWQKQNGIVATQKAAQLNFEGQTSGSYPPDCNGAVGPNHYMQTVNVTYAIYDKSGTKVAGPSPMNTLFGSVPGAGRNDGDPIVLYDEQADRWLIAEFSLDGSYGSTTDRMLVAVSATNDPTGSWHQYSFDVDDMPDYEKFGIWQDGYYMGTNNSSGDDIYAFERDVMLTGGANPQMVGFNNAWRPGTIDGFNCVPPVDNDGAFAPAGSPALFISVNDDAIGGGSDQLWIYELDVNWSSPTSSTFNRVQQLNIAAFDSNFGNNWDNIKQQGTTRELDAIPQVIMNRPQYRNFGSYQTLVCCHTVDVDASDHAGIRWYELRKTTGTWSVRQQGTYAPDAHSRWMGSVVLNGQGELGMGYSISSSSLYPGIRYTGQTSVAYANATGTMDVAEEIIHTGQYSQTGANRWGDYTNVSIDPTNDDTFWFSTEYMASSTHGTKIAAFNIGAAVLTANFTADNTSPDVNIPVQLTDLSTGGPITWNWTITPNNVNYLAGTTATSQNPQIEFTSTGSYTVSLTVGDGSGSDVETKTNYINVVSCGITSFPWIEGFENNGQLPDCWANEYVVDSQNWAFQSGGQSGNPASAHTGSYNAFLYNASSTANVTKLVTPSMDLSVVSNPELKFWHTQQLWSPDQDNLKVYYKTTAAGSWNLLQTWTNSITAWTQETIALPNPSATYYIAFEGIAQYGYGVCIDDVEVNGSVATAPGCTTAVSPNDGATNVAVTANLEWSAAAGASGYKLYFGTDNPPGNIANGVDLGNATSYNPAGDLAFLTDYFWKVVPYNAVGDATGCSVWDFTSVEESTGQVVELSFTDFESGWGIWTDGGGDCSLYTSGTYATQGNNAANIQDNSGVASSFYLTNGVDVHTAGYVQIDVEFEFIPVSMDGSEDFWVQYYNGSSWNTVATYVNGVDFVNGSSYATKVTILESQYTFPTDMKIRFMCDASGNKDDVYIDQIKISASTIVRNGEFLARIGSVNSEIENTVEEIEEIKLYPNPAENFFFIEGREINGAQLYVFDMQSRLMINQRIKADNIRVSTEGLKPGIYMVQIVSQYDIKSRRIVIR
ncbi:MAG: T9SS type A sorting domain-containing protein [Bacteroidales bacterium]|nr:T9SS type A sorting domain-containing protein [Bacteroidales bacterium]